MNVVDHRWALRRVVRLVAVLNLAYFGIEFAVAVTIGSVSLFAGSIDFLEDASVNPMTHPRIYAPPTPIPLALEQVDAWIESPSLMLLAESPQRWATLRALVLARQIAGPRVHDARIAALCRQHGVRELWSADRDFGRFLELVCVTPLVA